RLNAANAANQSMKCFRVIERIPEFDPGRGSQKSGQAVPFRPLCAGQENGNHAKTPTAIADAPFNRGAHLLVLPGTKAAGTHKDGTNFRFFECLFNGWLPGIAGNKMPLVQPSLYPLLREAAS